MARSAVTVRDRENTGIIPNRTNGVILDLNCCGRTILRVNENWRARRSITTGPDIRVVIDATLDDSIVDAEDVDVRPAAAIHFRVILDIEVQVGGVLRAEINRSSQATLPVECVPLGIDTVANDI